MILDEMYGSCLLEYDPNMFGGQETSQKIQGDNDPEEPTEPPEFKSLKKFHLVSRIQSLKSQLDEVNITSDELELVLKFSIELSYETLVRLTDSITEIIKLRLQEMNKNDKNKE